MIYQFWVVKPSIIIYRENVHLIFMVISNENIDNALIHEILLNQVYFTHEVLTEKFISHHYFSHVFQAICTVNNVSSSSILRCLFYVGLCRYLL
jgi:hypothetical protein